MMELLRTFYKMFGVPHPVLSTVIMAFVGALVFGGAWFLLGKQIADDQQTTQVTTVKTVPQHTTDLTKEQSDGTEKIREPKETEPSDEEVNPSDPVQKTEPDKLSNKNSFEPTRPWIEK